MSPFSEVGLLGSDWTADREIEEVWHRNGGLVPLTQVEWGTGSLTVQRINRASRIALRCSLETDKKRSHLREWLGHGILCY